MSEARFRAAASTQADWCRVLGAPFTARLCDALAQVVDRSTPVGRRLLDWPGDLFVDAMTLRLVAGINAQVRSGAAEPLAALFPPRGDGDTDALAAALPPVLADPAVLPWLDLPVQTNEVARSAVLMPGLMTVAATFGLPLALHELGASAGLNLRLDHYAYDLGGLAVGPPDAPIRLTPAWDGAPPPRAEVRVVARRGVDLNPIDLRQETPRARLLAFVWPEQEARRARLEAAIDAFRADPVPIDHGDAADWVDARVVPAPGVATVVMNTIAFQYFPPESQARIVARMDALGSAATADAPLAWLRFELKGAETGSVPALRLTMWPGGEDRLLATAHPHGASVTWLG